jgi:xanthine dehydrogenase YagR molybdenum-binding subunit
MRPSPRARCGAPAAAFRPIALALTGRDAPFAGATADEVEVTDGRLALAGKNLNISDAELFARNGLPCLVADGDYDPLEEH